MASVNPGGTAVRIRSGADRAYGLVIALRSRGACRRRRVHLGGVFVEMAGATVAEPEAGAINFVIRSGRAWRNGCIVCRESV